MSFSFRSLFRRQSSVPSLPFSGEVPLLPEDKYQRGVQLAGGQGVAQDYRAAARLYAEAAEQNYSPAQLNLASLYQHGQGVLRDEARAVFWLTRAANLGNASAQYRLGIHHYLASRHEPVLNQGKARIEALKWVRLSAAQACQGAAAACEFVALGMTRDEVAESARQAAAFVTD